MSKENARFEHLKFIVINPTGNNCLGPLCSLSGQKGLFQNFDNISPDMLWRVPLNWTMYILFPPSWVKNYVKQKSMLGKLSLKYATPTLSKVSQSRLKAPEIQHFLSFYFLAFLFFYLCYNNFLTSQSQSRLKAPTLRWDVFSSKQYTCCISTVWYMSVI